MYSNLAKVQAFPLVIRVSSKPTCVKQFQTPKLQSLPIGSYSKPSLNPISVHFTSLSHEFDHKSHKVCNFVTLTKASTGFQWESMEIEDLTRARRVTSRFRLRSAGLCRSIVRARSFSSSYSQRVGEGSRAVRAGKALPWLCSRKFKESKGLETRISAKSSRSWQESVKSLENVGSSLSWEESARRLEEGMIAKTSCSSWEESAESRNRLRGGVKDRKNGYGYNERDDHVEEEDKEGEEELGIVDDPRWDKIKNKFRGMGVVKDRAEKPELRRWTKQENWGRKTWKEATDSTLPKMVGEGVYGVGPVLAALLAKRREFYALYIQEGLDLSGNNKKKKDKKGFEKVLRMARKIGLSITEVSKHDLNMVVDNRPHQGLVLDASPLEMVKINELEAVMPGDDKGSLWVALDEVTDPQNLGAIIRSAYFFGASGVVLCAKNSAPLSGVVSKASAGSLELMELRYSKNMMQFLVSSAENGWRIVGGSVSSKAVPLSEVLPGEPTVLVLGSEGTGLRPLVERSCTQLVRIPGNIPVNVTSGGGDNGEAEETNLDCSSEEFRSFLAVESLNVSVAAGVMLHHFIGNIHGGNCSGDGNSVDVSE